MSSVLNPMGRWVRALMLFGALSGASFAQAGFIVDSFDDAYKFWAIGLASPNPFVDATAIPGFARELEVTVVAAPNPLSSVGSIGGGSFFANTSVPASLFTLEYTPTGGIFDLSESLENDRFVFDFEFVDTGFGTSLELGVLINGAGGLIAASLPISETSLPTTVEIPFTSFVGDPASFLTATQVIFVLNGPLSANVDFQLNEIRVVPEASSMVMVGMASAAGLFAVRRRRAA